MLCFIYTWLPKKSVEKGSIVLIFIHKSICKLILTCKNWSWLQTTIIIYGSENLAGWIRTRESKLDPVFSDLSGTRYSPNNSSPWALCKAKEESVHLHDRFMSNSSPQFYVRYNVLHVQEFKFGHKPLIIKYVVEDCSNSTWWTRQACIPGAPQSAHELFPRVFRMARIPAGSVVACFLPELSLPWRLARICCSIAVTHSSRS